MKRIDAACLYEADQGHRSEQTGRDIQTNEEWWIESDCE